MPQRFCTHMEEYGVQFIRTEAAYQAFNAMVDRAVTEQDDASLRQTLENALQDWQQETTALRNKFVELVKEGKIKLPQGALAKDHQHKSTANGSVKGSAKCGVCLREIPRLVFPEWQVAHNGTVNFRGEELDTREAELTLAP